MNNIKPNKRSFAIIGGDMRQIRIANTLLENGEQVSIYGFDSSTPNLKLASASSIDEAIKDANIIILPMPVFSEPMIINTPFFREKLEVSDLLKKMNKNQILLGGKIDSSLKTQLDIRNIYFVDYLLREELSVLNAVPTAEGGIALALNEMPTTLSTSRCLVIGFGRIGKVLCKMLDGIGAKVCACARSPEALAWIDAYGYNKANTNELSDIAGEYDIIFNTVPHKLIDENVLKNIRTDSLIIDLASKPGGVDFDAATKYGIKAIWALSLPGRIAPISAGDIIKQTIFNICDELGV